MILLDAGVLIRYLRHTEPALENLLETLDLGICGVTRAEILHGAKSDADAAKVTLLLNQFHQISLSEGIWDQTGMNLSKLRRHGIIVPFTDVVLASVALEQDLEVWTHDAHFKLIATVCPVRLFTDPLTD